MDLLGDIGHVESCFNPFRDSGTVNPFGDSGVLVQVTCMVCAKRTIVTEIIFGHT
jgi:hypothetical protein